MEWDYCRNKILSQYFPWLHRGKHEEHMKKRDILLRNTFLSEYSKLELVKHCIGFINWWYWFYFCPQAEILQLSAVGASWLTLWHMWDNKLPQQGISGMKGLCFKLELGHKGGIQSAVRAWKGLSDNSHTYITLEKL